MTFFLVGFLKYVAAGNWLDTVIILIDIPVACTGGVLALLITGMHFNVSAAMGFISVFGIAVQGALLMASYFQQLHCGGKSTGPSPADSISSVQGPEVMT